MIKKKAKKIDWSKYPVYEHLDVFQKCSYAERLQWLEDANEFVWMLQRKKNYPNLSCKK